MRRAPGVRSRMSLCRLPVVALCALALLGALACTLARAAGAVAMPSAPVAEFPAGDALEQPQSLAVDASSGDVYVLDSASETIDKFDAAGNPVAFTATGSYISGNQLTGTPTGGLELDGAASASEIAVDNAAGPFAGDIFVAAENARAVEVFASDGEYLGALQGPGGPESIAPCGVAVDGSGRVYVANSHGSLVRYVPTGSSLPVGNGDYATSEITVAREPCSIAADSAGDVFELKYNGPLYEYAAGQFPASGSAPGEPREIAESGRAVAVDPRSGRVYDDEGLQISVLETAGASPELLEVLGLGALSGSSDGVAVADTGATPTVYATDEAASPPAVYVFGTPAPVAPTVASESVANVTAETADLLGRVDPEFSATKYHFEYGPTSTYGTSVPVGERDAGETGGPFGVQGAGPVHLTGLQPGSIYHYRLVATNGHGTAFGADATFTTQSPAAAVGLLDGRAYELVSPPEKEGALLLTISGYPGPSGGGVVQAEAGGEAITYLSNGAFQQPVSAPLGSQYLATRAAGGWSNANITPPTRSGEGAPGHGGPYEAFAADLSSGLLRTAGLNPAAGAHVASPPLAPGAPAGYENYVLRSGLKSGAPGSFEAALTAPPSVSAQEFEMELAGSDPQLQHVVLRTSAALTPGASPGQYNLYEWTPGVPGAQLQPVSVLPGETSATPFGSKLARSPNAISDGGTRVYFEGDGGLYLREGQSTTLVSSGGRYWAISGDGSRAFFTDSDLLTANAGFEDLYMFEAVTGKVVDIAPHGDVQGVLGASEDGSYVYFVANGALAPGAVPGHCLSNSGGDGTQWRKCNLYVWHEGALRFIASLSGEDETERPKSEEGYAFSADDWAEELINRTARVSADGLHVVFMSSSDLTGYESVNAETGLPEQEVYAYDAATRALNCLSCDPTGARPIGPSAIPAGDWIGGSYGGSGLMEAQYLPRVISDEDGHARVFFDSANPLVSNDTNGVQDVYEWEEAGRGSCQSAVGCTALISSGTSSEESLFLDAGANGDDVFFLTRAQLTAQDHDNLLDIYDARAPHVPGEAVGAPSALAVTAPCENGDACRPAATPQPTVFAAPPSATFNGAGNPTSPQSGGKTRHKTHHSTRRRSHGRRHTRKRHDARRPRARGRQTTTRKGGK